MRAHRFANISTLFVVLDTFSVRWSVVARSRQDAADTVQEHRAGNDIALVRRAYSDWQSLKRARYCAGLDSGSDCSAGRGATVRLLAERTSSRCGATGSSSEPPC